MDKRAINPPTYYSFLVLLMTMLLLLPVWSEHLPSSGRRKSENQEDEEEESLAPMSREEMLQIRERIIRSLGITRVPDISKANVSAEEKAEAYRTYLHRLQDTQRHRMLTRDLEEQEEEMEDDDEEKDDEVEETAEVTSSKYVLQATTNSDDFSHFPVRLHFSLNIPNNSSTSSSASSANLSALSPPSSGTLRLLRLININKDVVSRPRPPLVTLLVYHISGSERALVSRKRVVVIPERDSGWETMDVTQALLKWPAWYETNASIVLELDCEGCDSGTVISPSVGKNINSENATGSSLDDTVGDNVESKLNSNLSSTANVVTSVEAFLDLVFDGSSPRRQKRETRHRKQKANKKRANELELYKRTWPSTDESTDCKKGTRGKCCRHRMYVNFSLLQMEFVVEPQGFEAFYCKGKCPRHYNPAHTHALIQSTMHALKKAPRPCCAPSKLSNLTIMHYDENNKLKVTDWTNAVVDECGCS